MKRARLLSSLLIFTATFAAPHALAQGEVPATEPGDVPLRSPALGPLQESIDGGALGGSSDGAPAAGAAPETDEPSPTRELDPYEELTTAPAESHSNLQEALLGGRTWVDLRYRFEGAEVRGFLDRSWASTLRTAVGYETGVYEGLRALVEVEAVGTVLGNSYNDGTGQSPGAAPVLDPEGIELNQAYLGYADEAGDLDLRLGRQEISIGNERFVGPDPWRQNHQSFDAFRAIYGLNDRLTLDYAFVYQVHRVLGDDNPSGDENLKSHFIDARYDAGDKGRFAAYAFLNDFADSATLSSNTFGARYRNGWTLGEALGSDVTASGTLEYARQTDAYDNPVEIDADYFLARGDLTRAGLSFGLGLEVLGGGDQVGDKFSTPFASVQDFNGYADVFRITPEGGLRDRWVEAAYDFDVSRWAIPVTLRAVYHWFDADDGDADYGTERDFDALVRLAPSLSVGARYADFNGDEVFRNANRLAAWVSFQLR